MANTTRGTTNAASQIASHLQGAPKDKQRRAEILQELLLAFERGPDGVTDNLKRRLDALDGEFANRLDELKELL
jgi:hypothetical protein